MPAENSSLPKITVVTPSYNQGRFLEQTINSVLSQNYPNLEYIVMDGGSTDESVDIIRKYESSLKYWQSRKDKGQSDAINQGFTHASGDILCWLNSDDYFMPGTLHRVASLIKTGVPHIVSGETIYLMEADGTKINSNAVYKSKNYALGVYCYIIQPSTFWTKETWQKMGPLSAELHFGFDWEWFLKAQKAGIEFDFFSETFSVYRIHDSHKTGSGGEKREQELIKIMEQYAGKREAEAFRFFCGRRVQVRNFLSFIRSAGLGRFDTRLLKLRYPARFSGIRDTDLRQILQN